MLLYSSELEYLLSWCYFVKSDFLYKLLLAHIIYKNKKKTQLKLA